MFDFLVAAAAWVAGAGSPAPHTAEVIGAWAPVALALGTIVATFLVGRIMFDPLTGLLAATLLAIMPGPFLDRTVLGYVDHHAAEACFSAFTLYAIAAALQRSPSGRPNAARAAAVRSVGAGLALGLYLLTWTSGAFLVFIIAVWAGVQCVLDSFTHTMSARVPRLVATTVSVAALIVVAFEDARVPQHDVRLGALAATFTGVMGLDSLRRLWRRTG